LHRFEPGAMERLTPAADGIVNDLSQMKALGRALIQLDYKEVPECVSFA